MRLLFVGDVMLGRDVNEALRRQPPEALWGDTLELFRGMDARVCNLECTISERGQPWRPMAKPFHFRSDAKNVAVLTAAGIHAVSLANNHALDFGAEALADTIGVLDAAGIAHAGAGADLAAALRPAVWTAAAARLSLLAFTDNEPEWAATSGAPGVCFVPVELGDPRAERFMGAVRAAKAASDLVIVAAHWGSNWGYRVPQEHRAFSRALVEAGADVVFGHSGHVCRGLEIDRGRPVLYCAGNFVDDYAVDPVERNDESFIFVVEFEAGRLRAVRLYPTMIEACRARRAGRRELCIAYRMQDLCEALGTQFDWDTAEHCLVRLAPVA